MHQAAEAASAQLERAGWTVTPAPTLEDDLLPFAVTRGDAQAMLTVLVWPNEGVEVRVEPLDGSPLPRGRRGAVLQTDDDVDARVAHLLQVARMTA